MFSVFTVYAPVHGLPVSFGVGSKIYEWIMDRPFTILCAHYLCGSTWYCFRNWYCLYYKSKENWTIKNRQISFFSYKAWHPQNYYVKVMCIGILDPWLVWTSVKSWRHINHNHRLYFNSIQVCEPLQKIVTWRKYMYNQSYCQSIETANQALHGIGVKVARAFRVRHVFSIHSLCSSARPPRELRR